MSVTTTAPSPPSRVEAALARDSLGVRAVVFYVMSGIAPMTVAAGIITTAFAVTGLIAIPAAFVIVALVLAVFSAGYVAMARHIRNSGAFYAFVAQGLGRPLGVGVALVALVAYMMLAEGLYGAFGPGAASEAADKLHIHGPWWAFAVGAWAVVAVLGRSGVKITGWVLAVLLTAELVVTVALTLVGLTHPAGHHVSVATLNPVRLLVGGVGAVLAVGATGYVGFEAGAVLSEEARNRRRTIAIATYLSLGLIALIYTGASWALAVHYGDDQVVTVTQQQGPAALFGMAGGALADAGQLLYLTSIFAAMLAFHSFVVRYMFALGREGVLPRVLARTGRSGAPQVASLVHSLIGLAVIAVWAVMHWDPMTTLFFWLGTTGSVGILLLLCVVSLSVIVYFARRAAFESAWNTKIAPAIATVLLGIGGWLVLRNYPTLLGVPPGHPATNLPYVFAAAALIGIVWGLILRTAKPEVYQGIGLGADAVLTQGTPSTAPRVATGEVVR